MKILIIGGYGNFGKRLLDSLLKYHDHEVIIAGRTLCKSKAVQNFYATDLNKNIGIETLDILSHNLGQTLKKLNIDIVINASGPYQLQRESTKNYNAVKACIESACHYIDLADDRAFVNGFSPAFHHAALDRNIMLVSGASTVPGLSTAVIDEFIGEFTELTNIRYGISPGNQTERGEATVRSILSYAGKPVSTLTDAKQQLILGWQNLSRYDFGKPLGKRWMSNCEIPDLDLLPERYPSLKSIHFQAGLELTALHLGLWFLSGLVRIRLIRNLSQYARPIIQISQWFKRLGSDNGGMYMELEGIDSQHKYKKIIWQLTAKNGSGPNIPAIPAELVINKIANGNTIPGAMPCTGLFNLTEFFDIAKRWDITQHWKNYGTR